MENICEWENCKKIGNFKAPLERDNSKNYKWLCEVHIKLFNKNKVQYGFHYPKSINQLAIFKKTFSKNRFANAEKLAKKGISLPIDPNLEIKQVKKIVKLINSI